MAINPKEWSVPSEDVRNRLTLWDHTFSELIEILALMECKAEAISGPDIGVADRLFSSRHTIWQLVLNHLRQHLATKAASIFQHAGDKSRKSIEPVAENEIIREWNEPMLSHARTLGVDVDVAWKLWERLRYDRNNYGAHKSGDAAEISKDQDGSRIYRADPLPLSSSEIEVLKLFFRACRDFVRYAALYKGEPKFPYDLARSKFSEAKGTWQHETSDIGVLQLSLAGR